MEWIFFLVFASNMYATEAKNNAQFRYAQFFPEALGPYKHTSKRTTQIRLQNFSGTWVTTCWRREEDDDKGWVNRYDWIMMWTLLGMWLLLNLAFGCYCYSAHKNEEQKLHDGDPAKFYEELKEARKIQKATLASKLARKVK